MNETASDVNKEAKDVWIDLRRNNAITNDPCAICGERCDPCGLDFFLGESEALVCGDCASDRAPHLIELLHCAVGNYGALLKTSQAIC